MRMNERKELHNISQTRVSKWPNTIQAERERKEYERIKKLEDDEVSHTNTTQIKLKWATNNKVNDCHFGSPFNLAVISKIEYLLTD